MTSPKTLPGQAPEGVRDARNNWELVLVTSERVDALRFRQLSEGLAVTPSLLLRSASSLTPRVANGAGGWALSPLLPQTLIVSNSELPFSQNYGSLWAGKGVSSRVSFGAKLEGRQVRLIVAPELVSMENSDWLLRRYPYNQEFNTPAVPPEHSGGGYVFPFYYATFPIDQPMRFGDQRVRRLDAGQSSLLVSFGRVEAGVSNEHEWWGPGIRNAIVLSNNAPGFPHLLLRTARPLRTRFGRVEARWLVGGLTESEYFDTVSTNDVRSLASIAATLETAWDPNLTFGIARSVYATTSRGFQQGLFRWFDVFARTRAGGEPAGTGGEGADTAYSTGGRDQLFSLFARWVFPQSGFEAYGELARKELRPSIKHILVAPNHSQAYTLGFQFARPAWRSGTFRLHAELTQMESAPAPQDPPSGSWYTSRRVIQGYTNRGEILGGAIGPGASSQWLALDYISKGWRLGAFAGRIRWNEDVHAATPWPIHVFYCNHDVSVYPGARGAAWGRFGTVTVDYSLQNRLNAFFQNDGGCPNLGERLDIRNNSLSITFSPFSRR
ncbi:MAG: capsule assembly Wzi family protein [Gemmatimonadota bacterium]|nr:capsule assembly Wzi family protein [Gemmatimonadota bacterium]